MDEIAAFDGYVECENPNSKTNDFSGTLYDTNRNILGNINCEAVLMRGCVLRNTEWIYGLVVSMHAMQEGGCTNMNDYCAYSLLLGSYAR